MTMDSIEKLNTAITVVDEARGVPLSASCVVHRGEMLEILEAARDLLPKDLFSAQVIIGDKEQIIEEGRTSAEAMIASAVKRSLGNNSRAPSRISSISPL